MFYKKNSNGEFIAYTMVCGKIRSVGVFWTKNEARDYCGKYYNDWKIEGELNDEE